MTKDDLEAVYDSLHRFITYEILRQPNRRIADEEPLISSGLIDSFSLVDLALFVEESHNVHIADTELNAATFDSLSELVMLIYERKKTT